MFGLFKHPVYYVNGNSSDGVIFFEYVINHVQICNSTRIFGGIRYNCSSKI